jgi:hypothetical protein
LGAPLAERGGLEGSKEELGEAVCEATTGAKRKNGLCTNCPFFSNLEPTG